MKNKPIYLIPFIMVYRIVSFILCIPISICKYFYKGLRFIITLFVKICIYLYKFLIGICILLWLLLKTICISIIKIFIGIYNLTIKGLKQNHSKKSTIKEELLLSKSERKKIIEIKLAEKEKLKKQSLKKLESKRKQLEEVKTAKVNKKDSYVNENAKVKKENIFDTILNYLNKIPEAIKEKFKNNDFAKNKRNKDMMKREALLINFDGDDALKSDKKVLYEYVAKNPEGKVVKDYFEAFSKVEVHSFLLSEGFEVYSIRTNKWIQLMHKNANTNNPPAKPSKPSLIFTALGAPTIIKITKKTNNGPK